MQQIPAMKISAENAIKQNHHLQVIDLYAGQGGFIAGFNRIEGWHHYLAVELTKKHCEILK